MIETHSRTLVKTILFRLWELISTYILLKLLGIETVEAINSAIIMNLVWTIGYYFYERIWNTINWGKK
jgi:uncharacterized membrane protein